MRKSVLAAAAVLALAFVMGGCSTGQTTGIDSSVAQANPWTEYASLEEAQEAAGFELELPDMSDYGDPETYQYCTGLPTIEVDYKDGSYIRKAQDTEDVSGDYNEYEFEATAEIGESTVTLKGDSEDSIRLATWQSGKYSYAISLAEGVSTADMTALVEATV